MLKLTAMIDTQTLKTELQQFNSTQKSLFSTEDIKNLLEQRSHFYDDLLTTLWQQFGFMERQDLALVAVGGYGRREMFPLSDLDILVLSEQPLDEQTQNQLNQLFNLLWDCKFQLGASVRTLAECVEVGRAEISVATNMFESRFLLGNEALWQQLMSKLFHAEFWSIQAFFEAKMAEKNERYARYHNTSYNLEPDLKHSPGGLRDLHLLSWIMLRHYGLYSLESLFSRGLLYSEEFIELQQAQHTLFRMRFALHLQLKRYDNRLRFDRQLQLSEQLGYQGEGNQPVEAMMKDFFQATQSISQLTQLLLNHFHQEVLQALQNVQQKQPLDDYFYLQGEQLICSNPLIFKQQPERILDLFFYLTQHTQVRVASTTLRQLRLALQTLNQPLCELPQARRRFIRLFSQPDVVKRAIMPMHQLGVLTAYLPQWVGIQGLMQFDLFHIYTVDEHTIQVMLKLESFLQQENAEKHPLCCRLFPTLADRPLLYLSALFHDIAKGREGDHAKVGAEDMRAFAQRHGFSQEQSDYMAWLVAEHLTMSITAQRRDIHDPDVVKTFANVVKNPTALAALTCLTVADICATNETLWNDWKRSLFLKLFQFTEQQLQLGSEETINHQQLSQAHQQQAYTELEGLISAEQKTRLLQFWQSCPESYFVRNSPTQLYWHALHYLKDPALPMVLISNQYARGATEIFVHCQDQAQLFARIAQMLSQKKVSIHDAQILTSDHGLVLDSFIITEMNGEPLDDERSEQIQSALLKTLLADTEKVFNPSKKSVKHQAFKRKTKIRFLANSQPNQTAFELFTLDREGLLAQIGYIFGQLKLNLLNAKITTIGERVEDFFVVSNQQNGALAEEEQAMLKQHLLAMLEQE